MIEGLLIKNFRAIAQCELALKPGLNVLIGPNGSGKSSLVEALRFLHEAIVSDPTRALSRWRGWASVRHRGPVMTNEIALAVGMRVHRGRGSAEYGVFLDQSENGIDVRVQREFLDRRGESRRTLLSAVLGKGNVLEGQEWLPFELSEHDLALRYHADRVRHKEIIPFAEDIASWRFVNPVPALMRPPTPPGIDAAWHESGISVALQLARATKPQLAEVSRRMAGLVEGTEGLEARLSSEGALVELKEQVHHGLFPSWTLSDGTLRVLAILTALYVGPPPALLCVEEPENSLHPSVIDNLLTEFRDAAERGTQVIITSHSPYLLNRLNLDVDAAFFVDRPGGAARFTPLPGDERTAREMERFGLGELLAQGALTRST